MSRTLGANRHHELYREVNKRIREVSESFGTNGEVQYLCECGLDDCDEHFTVTNGQFDGLLSDPSRVMLAAAHRSSLDGRRVVAEYETFVVVQEE